MSKTVYLLTNDGNIVAFGAGMTIFRVYTKRLFVANTSGSDWEAPLSEHADSDATKAAQRSWIRLISKCADGALLRWDESLGQVVEGLEEDVFDDTPLLADVHPSPNVTIAGGR